MMISSMYSWLGVLYEVLYSLHSAAATAANDVGELMALSQ